MAVDSTALVEHLFRRQAGQIVARLTRTLGPRHLALAEDAVQDALISALQQWPFRGVPDQPEAWLYQVARNRALDRLRHAKMAAGKEPALTREQPDAQRPAGERARAAASYREALTLARSAPEQRWLRSRLTHLV